MYHPASHFMALVIFVHQITYPYLSLSPRFLDLSAFSQFIQLTEQVMLPIATMLFLMYKALNSFLYQSMGITLFKT